MNLVEPVASYRSIDVAEIDLALRAFAEKERSLAEAASDDAALERLEGRLEAMDQRLARMEAVPPRVDESR